MTVESIPQNLESVLILMSELGPKTPEISAIVQSDEDKWAVEFEDDSIVTIEWVDDPSRLILTASLNFCASDMNMKTYESLLGYNSLWRDTSGMKIAMRGTKGEVIVLIEVFTQGLSSSDFSNTLINFLRISNEWNEYIGLSLTNEISRYSYSDSSSYV